MVMERIKRILSLFKQKKKEKGVVIIFTPEEYNFLKEEVNNYRIYMMFKATEGTLPAHEYVYRKIWERVYKVIEKASPHE
jgi:hypothetical protein